MKLVHSPDPGPLKAEAYPVTGDQLDAMWKFIAAVRVQGVVTIPEETLEVLDTIIAIKDKFKTQKEKSEES